MAQHLYRKKINGKVYYYLHETFRQKIDPKHSGRTRGSGKSRVVTRATYLGTEEAIIQRLQQTAAPLEVRHRQCGWVAAVYQVAEKIGLLALLQKHLAGQRFGIPRWIYFFLAIANRLDQPTSKAKIREWVETTLLPDLLAFPINALSSQSFWYATDDVLSEKALRQKRTQHPELGDQLLTGLDDTLWQQMEEELVRLVQKQFDLGTDTLLYDTTNFFTYIEEPARALLAQAGHNKDCHHHLKQVGLALAVERQWGLPLFHRLYRGNRQDSKTLAELVRELIDQIRKCCQAGVRIVLVLDKGNNSEDNFAQLKEDVDWVGSLTLSHYKELRDKPLSEYPGQHRTLRYVTEQREVMGVPCLLVLTYHERLARKQEHTLQRGLEKLKEQIRQQWKTYRKTPRTLPKGIPTLLKKHRYGKLLDVTVVDGAPAFALKEAEVAELRQSFGKNLLFTNRCAAAGGWVIDQYRSKDKIEQDFKLIKAPELIRFRPIRHWTDTRIRAFGFCCVVALLLLRVMLLMTARAGLHMSAAVLKEELSDIKEYVVVYSPTRAQTQISRRSAVQQKLWDLFELSAIERRLLIHKGKSKV